AVFRGIAVWKGRPESKIRSLLQLLKGRTRPSPSPEKGYGERVLKKTGIVAPEPYEACLLHWVRRVTKMDRSRSSGVDIAGEFGSQCATIVAQLVLTERVVTARR